MIPVAKKLLELNQDVIWAVNEEQDKIIKNEIPDAQTVLFNGYNIRYSKNNTQLFAIALQTPKIIRRIKNEHKETEQLVSKHNINAVISDNRWGAYSNKVPSVIVTHQLNIRTPFFSGYINKKNNQFIRCFSQCWIPDDPMINLSGDLSKNNNASITTEYIGLLSGCTNANNINKQYDLLCIISGPEPQRSIFEKKVTDIIANSNLFAAVAGGTTIINKNRKIENIEYFPLANSRKLSKLIAGSKLIIARSGYSTLMDLCHTNGNAVLIPTPGQPEQEYLAEQLEKKGIALKIAQSNLNSVTDLHAAEKYKGFNFYYSNSLLEKKLIEFIDSL